MKVLYTIDEIKQLLNAKSENVDTNFLVKGLSIDSRNLKAGDLFFCIQGKNKDGHSYITEALERGACGIVANVSKIPNILSKSNFPKILVSDPNQSLCELAIDVRNQFKGNVLAITGSNGKTTTKDILAGLCLFLDPQVYSTPGNFNNYFGVCLTLLNADLSAKWWIVEIGTNKFGEISELSKIVKPTAGIITNIGESHLEFLKSTHGVALEKSGLFKGMFPGKNVVIPDSIMHKELLTDAARIAGLKITEAFQVAWDMSDQKTTFKLFNRKFETSIKNPLMLQNLVLALTILNLEGVPVSKLLSATTALNLEMEGRFNQIKIDDWILIDDTYNANPSSFKSVLDNLKKMYQGRRKIVVCGAMAELGDLSNEFHSQIGGIIAKSGVSFLFGLGGSEIKFYLKGWKNEGGEPEAAKHFYKLKDLIYSFRQEIRKDDVVLVKGSRSSHMERFVDVMI